MKKYEIVRFYADISRNTGRAIKKNLTLEEAQEHCQREDTHKPGVWFDGYREQINK
jgi:hypothetical protein